MSDNHTNTIIKLNNPYDFSNPKVGDWFTHKDNKKPYILIEVGIGYILYCMDFNHYERSYGLTIHNRITDVFYDNQNFFIPIFKVEITLH